MIEILKIPGLTNNIEEYQKIYNYVLSQEFRGNKKLFKCRSKPKWIDE